MYKENLFGAYLLVIMSKDVMYYLTSKHKRSNQLWFLQLGDVHRVIAESLQK